MEKLLTMDEVCDYLSVSQRTIRRLVESQELGVVRVRRCWRFYEADVQAYLDSQRVEALPHVKVVTRAAAAESSKPRYVPKTEYVPGMKVV